MATVDIKKQEQFVKALMEATGCNEYVAKGQMKLQGITLAQAIKNLSR